MRTPALQVFGLWAPARPQPRGVRLAGRGGPPLPAKPSRVGAAAAGRGADGPPNPRRRRRRCTAPDCARARRALMACATLPDEHSVEAQLAQVPHGHAGYGGARRREWARWGLGGTHAPGRGGNGRRAQGQCGGTDWCEERAGRRAASVCVQQRWVMRKAAARGWQLAQRARTRVSAPPRRARRRAAAARPAAAAQTSPARAARR